MPKRKKVLNTSEDSKDGSECSKRKRSFLDPIEMFQEIYDTLRNYKTDDGRLVCETFIRAPNRRSLADYYDVISTPIDMLKIQQKLKTDDYMDLQQFSADIELMINNAKSYYKKNTQEYKDACELWEVFNEAKNDILSNEIKKEDDKACETDDDRASECSEDESIYEELFTTVMTAADMEGRALSTMFQLLPSRTLYPEYYKVITNPVDLKMIATKIQNNDYRSLCDMEKDLLHMIKNAKAFNEPGSQIYKDAATLRKIILIKKAEIDQRKTYPAKTSERIRNKRLAGGQKWSAIISALQYESDAIPKVDLTSDIASPPSIDLADESRDGDDGNESGPEDADNNPQWLLYETVKNYINPQGYQLSEPFWTLPNRRSYPDYYKEIKQPMSLFKIRTKVKTKQYTSLVDVVDDMNLMFENARKYNRPDSKLFKDAVKLQKIMQAKARELINLHMKDSESDDDEDRASKRKAKKLVASPILEVKKIRRSLDGDPNLKRKARILYKTLHDYLDDDGRPLISVFMEKPSKKDYPDYYEIIVNPIDMKTIDCNIKSEKYQTEESLIADFKLMFANCKQYNEEGSQIYQDAETLENVLNCKIQEMGGTITETPKVKLPIKRVVKEFAKEELHKPAGMKQKLRTFYDSVKEYTDPKGRKLSVIFNKLPSKTDYPDYFEVIKRPIDLDKIGNKLKTNQYETLEDMLSDFVLMFDNACKYNEPDSQIYKDALTLQRMTLQTKLELTEDANNGIPDVRALVQELLTDLFISTYNHQDEEGRCFSDSLVEFSETDSSTDPSKKVLNLDMIKRNLDKGKYKRLDRFQEDMFEVFEFVRHRSRTDSQVFEDSVELQSFFIKRRDVLCKCGEVLLSPALQYTEADLQASVETLRAQKLPREQQEAEMEPKQEKEETRTNEISSSDSAIFQNQTYNVGDFVYIEPREKGMEPHIMHVEKLWRDNQGEQWLYGCWFYRPNETFHLATRKFLEKEVFKSDNYNSTPLNQVIGKCYVMFVKDYFKFRPNEFEFKDVYVCESRYSAKAKAFKKIKIWNFTPNNYVHIVLREEQVDAVRVPSMFKDGFEKPKDESSDGDDPDIDVVLKPRPNLVCEVPNPDEGAVYYEQYTIPSGTYKLGDCCYVRTEHNKSLIGRIDKMWIDKTGNAFYHGPWFVTPQEVQHPPTRLFFRQEVFLSSIEDTNPLLSVIGHCAVLENKDYCTKRPTEVQEQDVFICESRYLEAERQIRRLTKGLKKIPLSSNVTEDEYYFFRKPLNPQKTEVYSTPVIVKKNVVPNNPELSPLMTRPVVETDNEESNDVSTPITMTEQENSLPPLSSSKKKSTKRIVTGYILFASEVRRSVIAANPDRSFGDISRLIGTEWRNLPIAKKADYEDRAAKQNEETQQLNLLGAESMPQSPASNHGSCASTGDRNENILYECLWDGCDHQFEDQVDLVEHLAVEPGGHIQQTFRNKDRDSEIQCLWYNCQRIKKNIPPFPNVARLIRHVKEVHLKTAMKNILPENRNRNYTPSKRNPPAALSFGALNSTNFSTPFKSASYNGGLPMSPAPPGISYNFPPPMPPRPAHISNPHGAKSLEPMFVAPPPKTQRLLHSNVYIKYIEGLQAESRYISNWDSHLKATPDTTQPPDPQRLPTHWLGNGVEGHGNALNALWSLRNYMLKDALNVAHIL
ncbi:LOW QUALITY PROTEIN: protein polybromo-1-like [Uloborus diversus]|uniref:LOW QUALITY PROTEIN: protein polybromo-1-like n=1 Tax=Uloborus diversus TaxID=327109 RepID=UPI002409BDEB|nr:LOW QUALITY PROTEIN: protein polybromo-1-like [Uloborus diversus]